MAMQTSIKIQSLLLGMCIAFIMPTTMAADEIRSERVPFSKNADGTVIKTVSKAMRLLITLSVLKQARG